MRFAVLLQSLALVGFPAGALILWGVGWSVLVAAAVCLVAGVALEMDAKAQVALRLFESEAAQQLRRAA